MSDDKALGGLRDSDVEDDPPTLEMGGADHSRKNDVSAINQDMLVPTA